MAILEQLVLDGLALNDVPNYRLQGFDAPPPKKRYEWAPGSDADGAALIRDPLFENREITARIRIAQRASMDLALAAVGAIVDKLEEAEKHPDGLDLVWTPANSTKSFTFKVLSGEVTGVPVSMDGDDAGWFKNAPVVTLTLTCKPFGYGPETLSSTSATSTPFVTITLAGVAGDVPAEGRLIFTDSATQARRYLAWGLEQRYYNAAADPLVDSDSMVVTGTAGAQTTRTGAYDPNATGNNVIRASLFRAPVAVAATGNLGHVGTFRVLARVWAAGSGPVYARLAWQEGDGPYRGNEFVPVLPLGIFTEIDLGVISIPPKDLGTQRWSGRIEAYSNAAATGDTLDVDYLILIPAGEGYGKARALGRITATAINGYDDFNSLTGGTGLNTRVAGSGGTWTTAGATTDFAGGTAPITGTASRATASDASRRFATLGSTNYTDVQAEVFAYTIAGQALSVVTHGVIARWVDANNYLYASWSTLGFRIGQVIAGTDTVLASTSGYPSPNTWWGIRLTAFQSGAIIAELRYGTGAADPTLVLQVSSANVATGGTLATGKPGFFDQNTNSTAVSRAYDFFSVSTPSAEPIVINSTRNAEIRSDTAIRADSTNTYWGPMPAYRGSRFYVPPAGDEARTSRIVALARRQDIETTDSSNVTDSTTVQVAVTPRYSVIPR